MCRRRCVRFSRARSQSMPTRSCPAREGLRVHRATTGQAVRLLAELRRASAVLRRLPTAAIVGQMARQLKDAITRLATASAMEKMT